MGFPWTEHKHVEEHSEKRKATLANAGKSGGASAHDNFEKVVAHKHEVARKMVTPRKDTHGIDMKVNMNGLAKGSFKARGEAALAQRRKMK